MNADRVKNKLPSILCDGPTTEKEHWNRYNRIVYRLGRLRVEKPEVFAFLFSRLMVVLEDFEEAVFKK